MTAVSGYFIRNWGGGLQRFISSLIAINLFGEFTCRIISENVETFYGIYLTWLLFSFWIAASITLLPTAITYLCSVESHACISARTNDMLKCKDRHISICAVQCSCCTGLIVHGAETLGKTIPLPYNVANIASIVIACFRSSCHRYQGLFLQRYCSCWMHGVPHTRWYPVFHYSTFATSDFLFPHYIWQPFKIICLCIAYTYWCEKRIYIRRRTI